MLPRSQFRKTSGMPPPSFLFLLDAQLRDAQLLNKHTLIDLYSVSLMLDVENVDGWGL